ncbi:hypothetical protein [uncultured Jannaschia sp.]|uniref:hypothetical protein n=1 Tax=uncultured Jannaschia sp. TaxID=293347 RepID=UPI00262CF532|nr:hypothetical protein [uncultured Jannaschia sp.]
MIDTTGLQRSARTLTLVLTGVQAFLVAGIFVLVAAAANTPMVLGHWLAGLAGANPEGMATWQAMALALLVAGQLGLWLGAAGAMRQTFAALGWLDPAGASLAARRAARWLWSVLIVGVLAHMAATGIATWHYPEGERMLGISLGSSQVSTALAALLAAFMARAFSLGADLWRDNRGMI